MDIVIFVIYCRFTWFRKALDAEMKDATGSGIAVATKKKERNEITEEEEKVLCEKKLLGRTYSRIAIAHAVFLQWKAIRNKSW